LVISTLIKCILSSCDSLYINYQLFSQRASSHRLQYYTININWFFGFCLSAYPKSSPFKVFISVIQWFNNIYCKAEKRRICMLTLYQTATFLLLYANMPNLILLLWSILNWILYNFVNLRFHQQQVYFYFVFCYCFEVFVFIIIYIMLLSYADFHFLQLVFCSWTIKERKRQSNREGS
jgi:hypothetical protein